MALRNILSSIGSSQNTHCQKGRVLDQYVLAVNWYWPVREPCLSGLQVPIHALQTASSFNRNPSNCVAQNFRERERDKREQTHDTQRQTYTGNNLPMYASPRFLSYSINDQHRTLIAVCRADCWVAVVLNDASLPDLMPLTH